MVHLSSRDWCHQAAVHDGGLVSAALGGWFPGVPKAEVVLMVSGRTPDRECGDRREGAAPATNKVSRAAGAGGQSDLVFLPYKQGFLVMEEIRATNGRGGRSCHRSQVAATVHLEYVPKLKDCGPKGHLWCGRQQHAMLDWGVGTSNTAPVNVLDAVFIDPRGAPPTDSWTSDNHWLRDV